MKEWNTRNNIAPVKENGDQASAWLAIADRREAHREAAREARRLATTFVGAERVGIVNQNRKEG